MHPAPRLSDFMPQRSRCYPMLRSLCRSASALLILALFSTAISAAEPVLKFLFLGDNGAHQPSTRLRTLAPVMMDRGIQLFYTEELSALTVENLRRYNGILIYADIEEIPRTTEKALLDYVRGGGGLLALHSAASSFRNSDAYRALLGAQHGDRQSGEVKTTLATPVHPLMSGFRTFESWEETEFAPRSGKSDRIVLERRNQDPWTWIRTEGKGRVFYTAWGHDDRTWSNPGFQDLIERGLRFIAGQDVPYALAHRPKIPQFELHDQTGIPYMHQGSAPRVKALGRKCRNRCHRKRPCNASLSRPDLKFNSSPANQTFASPSPWPGTNAVGFG